MILAFGWAGWVFIGAPILIAVLCWETGRVYKRGPK